MTARLTLHIGANKTGSSAIQRFLRLNAATLRGMGYLVPSKTLEPTGVVSGEQAFTFGRMIASREHAELRARLRALAGLAERAVLVSAENLANEMMHQHFHKILDGLACRVILYIRRQDEFLLSSWQQWHSKLESDVNAWLIGVLHRMGHWQVCIEGWESVVGPGNVVVRLYQRADLPNGDVIDDFIATADLGAPPTPFRRVDGTMNPSYPDVITAMASGNRFIFAHEHDNRFYAMMAALTGSHYADGPRLSLISPAMRERIVANYEAENERVRARWFPWRARLFEPVDHGRYQYLDDIGMMRQQISVLTSLVFALYQQTRQSG